jgi:Zn-dependent protease with chaperone function
MTNFAVAAAMSSIVCCLLLGLTTSAVMRRLRPAQAVVLLTAAALALSLACGTALTAIAVAVLATVTSIAAEGHWSAAVVRSDIALPGWLGVLAAAAVLVLLLRAGWRVSRITVALVRSERLCRTIRAGGGPVVIVDDDTADAFTLAGLRGCVVLGRRLLDHLTTDERRVVTAHELAHLRKRHHLYVHLADIAAAANPLLRAVPLAVRIGVERWADEEAAAGIGNRRITGRAVARVALIRSAIARSTGSDDTHRLGSIPAAGALGAILGVGHHAVAARVQALLQPAKRGHAGVVAMVVALAVIVLLVGTASLDRIQDIIENAGWYGPPGR